MWPIDENGRYSCFLAHQTGQYVLFQGGIEFEESPPPPGHAFFHGEKESPPLETNMVIAVGNCGLYTGPWGVRVEDKILVGPEEPNVLTRYPRQLKK
jgi:Xaa-Pro aminopeptidase